MTLIEAVAAAEQVFGRPLRSISAPDLRAWCEASHVPVELVRHLLVQQQRGLPAVAEGAVKNAYPKPPPPRMSRWRRLANPALRTYLQNLQRLLRVRNYSRATLKAYVRDMLGFAFWLRKQGGDLVPAVEERRVVDYMLERQRAGVSNQSLRGFRAALRLFCEANGQSREFQMIRTMRGKPPLPVVLTADEIRRMLEAVKNRKHWLMISLMYSSGLRVSEVTRLRVGDIYLTQHRLMVRQGKGKKDRVTIFSDRQRELLGEFMGERSGEAFLFESAQRPGKPLSVRSLQKVVERAIRAAGIRTGASAHSLRHSFATHLLEGGTDIRHIQKLLGHEHIRTTTTYTRVARSTLGKIQSPF